MARCPECEARRAAIKRAASRLIPKFARKPAKPATPSKKG